MKNEVIDVLTDGIAERVHELSEEAIREIRRERYDTLSETTTTMRSTNPVLQLSIEEYGE